jgi:hypothetical protein
MPKSIARSILILSTALYLHLKKFNKILTRYFALNHLKDIEPIESVDVKIYMLSHCGSDRIYIGATSKSLKKRLMSHKSNAKYSKNRKKVLSHKDCWIINAINNNHSILIEELDVVKFSEFSFWEKYYISLFKMFGFKLTNGTDGGQGVWPRRVSDKEREAIRSRRLRPVIEYDKNGNIINKYESLIEASEVNNINYSRLHHSARGNVKLCNGRMFRFENPPIDQNEIDRCFYPKNKEKRKPVIQFDLSGNFIAEYKSASHTPFNSPTQKSAISKACRGESKTKYGFIWKYKNEELCM